MSVEDLVYNLMNPEAYMFRIDDYEYYRFSDITPDLLIKMVSSWEVIENGEEGSYCLEIYTWTFFQDQLISGLELVCFSDDQVDAMIKSGTSLSNITDMTLTIDSAKELYSEQGYTKQKVRPLVYEYYANRLVEKLNSFIIEGPEEE